MRTIKEILVLIKEEFNKECYMGLCSATFYLWADNKITRDEFEIWEDYWEDHVKTRKVFYDSKGDKTTDPYWFAWRLGLKKPRNNWLDKHIKLNS